MALRLGAGAVLAVLLALAAPFTAGAGVDSGLACPGPAPVVCRGFLPGADGTPLDVDLALPGAERYPLIVAVHGWGGSKEEVSAHPGDSFFTERGYAVLRYSARGFGKSWGTVHLVSLDAEIADLQALVSQVVDDRRFGVVPGRIGVTGASYGGAHAWLAATRPVWTSPGGRVVRVAAAAPVATWTDLRAALIPNGRAAAGEVVGTAKASYLAALLGGGLRTDPERPYPNYDLYLLALFARIAAGEPYEAAGLRDPVVAAGLDEMARLRSAAAQEEWLRAIRRDPSLRVPVLAIQGWTDDLFPPVEALRMHERLREATGGAYPIAVYLGDLGHPRAANKAEEVEAGLERVGAWFDHWLLGKGRAPDLGVSAATTTPDSAFHPDLVLEARDVAGLAGGMVRVVRPGPVPLANPSVAPGALPADPLVDAAARALTEPLAPGASDRAAALLVSLPSVLNAVLPVPVAEAAPGGDLWYVGLGTVGLRATTTATDAQFDVRLWDRGPDGSVHLVDRGTYKHVGPPGALEASVPLAGNAWRFPAGHELLVEVGNLDLPFLRPNNLPSATVLEEVVLELPVRRTVGAAPPPAAPAGIRGTAVLETRVTAGQPLSADAGAERAAGTRMRGPGEGGAPGSEARPEGGFGGVAGRRTARAEGRQSQRPPQDEAVHGVERSREGAGAAAIALLAVGALGIAAAALVAVRGARA